MTTAPSKKKPWHSPNGPTEDMVRRAVSDALLDFQAHLLMDQLAAKSSQAGPVDRDAEDCVLASMLSRHTLTLPAPLMPEDFASTLKRYLAGLLDTIGRDPTPRTAEDMPDLVIRLLEQAGWRGIRDQVTRLAYDVPYRLPRHVAEAARRVAQDSRRRQLCADLSRVQALVTTREPAGRLADELQAIADKLRGGRKEKAA